MRSLQAKITFVYLALAALLVGLSVVALFELDRIADKAREGSKVAELVDAALEMRRFEKNHLLYGQPRDLEDHARYAGRARELLDRDAALLDALAGSGTAMGLRDDLTRYIGAMAAHADAPTDEALGNEVRTLGNRIVTVGEHLAGLERQSLNTALAAHQRNLLVWLAVVAVLLALTGALLARQVTRPLQAMETRMEAVASGQLTRLALDSPEREFVSLAEAFNHVLDELEQRQHTLVRAEKLASLGTLLSGVAHELNNPLSNISSSAQILKEDLPSPAGGGAGGEGATPDPATLFHRQLIEDIDAETLRARRIVRALLDYAGDREFKPAPVRLAELVDETLRFLKSKRPPGIEVRLDIAPELTVLGDRPRLQQVLLNLIINAWDAIGDLGDIGGELVHQRSGGHRRQERWLPRPRRPMSSRIGGDRPVPGGQRPRHSTRITAARVRPLLHHQGGGPRQRPRAVHLPRNHRRAWRLHRRRQPSGRWGRVPHPPARRHSGNHAGK
jgi:two-component system NtrC family sensor kinase